MWAPRCCIQDRCLLPSTIEIEIELDLVLVWSYIYIYIYIYRYSTANQITKNAVAPPADRRQKHWVTWYVSKPRRRKQHSDKRTWRSDDTHVDDPVWNSGAGTQQSATLPCLIVVRTFRPCLGYRSAEKRWGEGSYTGVYYPTCVGVSSMH